MQRGVVAVENSMESPQKIKNGTALWPSDSTSRNRSYKSLNTNQKEYMHSYVHSSIIYNSQDLETAQLPNGRWVDRMLWCIYAVEYYMAVKKKKKKEGTFTFFKSMEIVMLSEISQSEKDKYHMISHLYVESN